MVANWLLYIVIPVIILISLIRLSNNKYIQTNRVFFNIYRIIRIYNYYFNHRYNGLFYQEFNGKIKEGNKYIEDSKVFYILIKIFILFIIILLWCILNDKNVPILLNVSLIVCLVLLFVLIFYPVVVIESRIRKLETYQNQKNNKTTDIKLVVFISVVLSIILDIILLLLLPTITIKDILVLDFCLLILIIIFYKPMKNIFLKRKK